MDQVRIHRGTEQIMDGGRTRLALQQCMTLHQLIIQGPGPVPLWLSIRVDVGDAPRLCLTE